MKKLTKDYDIAEQELSTINLIKEQTQRELTREQIWLDTESNPSELTAKAHRSHGLMSEELKFVNENNDFKDNTIERFISCCQNKDDFELKEFINKMKESIDINEKALYIYMLLNYGKDEYYNQICTIFDQKASHLKGFDAMGIYDHPGHPDVLQSNTQEKDEIVRVAFAQATKGSHLKAALEIMKVDSVRIILNDELVKSICALGSECCYQAVQNKLKIKRSKNSIINSVISFIHKDEATDGAVVPIKSVQMVIYL